MNGPPGSRLRPVLLLVAGGFVLGWLVIPRSPPNPNSQLVDLVGELTRLQSTSTVVSSAIVSASAILASALIPLVVVWALYATHRPPKAAKNEQPVTSEVQQLAQPARPALAQDTMPKLEQPGKIPATVHAPDDPI